MIEKIVSSKLGYKIQMINNIQHLRGIAALSVVLFHIIGAANSYGFDAQTFGKLAGWGAFGVDIFFVISGFIMMHIQIRNPKTMLHFVKSRVIRIVPLYWLLSLAIYAAYLILPNFFRELTISVGDLLTSLFFIHQLLENKHPILYVGWTLEWEMLFYLLFAIAIATRNWLVGSVVMALVLAFIAVKFNSLIVFEFMLGMLIGYFFEKNKKISQVSAISMIIIGLIALIFWFLNKESLADIDRVFKWGVPSALIVFGALYIHQIKNKIFSLLGDASYSIYLIQVFTIPVFFKVIKATYPQLNAELAVLFCLIFSASVGIVIYWIVEKPITNYLRKSV